MTENGTTPSGITKGTDYQTYSQWEFLDLTVPWNTASRFGIRDLGSELEVWVTTPDYHMHKMTLDTGQMKTLLRFFQSRIAGKFDENL